MGFPADMVESSGASLSGCTAKTMSKGERLSLLVDELDSVVDHINNLKNAIGLKVSSAESDKKDDNYSLVRSLDEVPDAINSRCRTIHELIAELEKALK